MTKNEFKANFIMKHSDEMIVSVEKQDENGKTYHDLDADHLVNYLKLVDKIADSVFKEEN